MARNSRKIFRTFASVTASLTTAAAAGPMGLAANTPRPATEQADTHAWTFHHENVLGTSMEVTVRASDRLSAHRAEAALLAVMDSRTSVLSAWNSQSELSRWAATRGTAEKISPELMRVLLAFDEWRDRTNGALDASAESAARVWKQATAEGRRPTDTEIRRAVVAMQQQHWTLDRAAGTATRLTDAPLALASFAKSIIASDAADEAIRSGAKGVMLNIGGDIVVRGAMTQVVEIADPAAHAETETAMEQVVVTDRAVATSGSYRRGFDLASNLGVPHLAPQFSHILDPRTAQPAGHILSSTVIARDAETAGALATAFSVLQPEESAALAARTPGVAYLLVTRNGERIASTNWTEYQMRSVLPVGYVAPHAKSVAASTAAWNQNYELMIQLELARIDSPRYRRPYVAVWVEDKDHFPVRTIALWFQKPRWLPDLKSWYRDDQVRSMAEGSDISRTVSSATRAPGTYTLKWDGKDNDGKLVQAGKYTICVEVTREHGTYEIQRQEMDFNAKPQQATLPAGTEMGAVSLAYRKK
jgi:FAD:protein FMN transferase